MPTLRLILGDSFEVIATLEGVGAVITDPCQSAKAALIAPSGSTTKSLSQTSMRGM